jgi:pyrroloquinoline quinone biosynthesis protein B
VRCNPIEAVLLTNADLDHVLGLMLLREGERLTIYATPTVRATLAAGLRLDEVLNTFCGVDWREPSAGFRPMPLRDGVRSGLSARAIALPGAAPRFAGDRGAGDEGHSVAWEIVDEASEQRALIAPHVATMTKELDEAMSEADALLFDGTFWSDDELQRVKPSARTAAQMGHWPVQESLRQVMPRKARWKVYTHINNTNPILAADSPERAQVEAAGVAIGEDGMECEL